MNRMANGCVAGLVFAAPTILRNVSSRSFAVPGTPKTQPKTRPSIVVLSQILHDLFGHFLGVAEEHHRVVAEEELVLDARITAAHAALDEEHGFGFLHVE